MAEAKSGPDWQKITGCTIAATVMLCILLALFVFLLIFLFPVITYALDTL